MHPLDKSVSFLPHGTQAHDPETVNLLEYLTGGHDGRMFTEPTGEKWRAIAPEYRDAIRRHFVGQPLRKCAERYRQELSRKGKTPFLKALKEFFPGIIPTGHFSHRNEKSLIAPSYLAHLDFDLSDNPYSMSSVKAAIKNLANVAYAGLSLSGNGLCVFVPISEPGRYAEHWNALRADFESIKLLPDPICRNLASFRFYAPDPACWINPDAVIYTKFLNLQPEFYASKPPAHINGLEWEQRKVEIILEQIKSNRADITDGYNYWFSIGCDFADTFGESGRDYFHRVSQNYCGYRTTDADRQYNKCLKRAKSGRNDLSAFFKRAQAAGFEYRSHVKKSTATTTTTTAAPMPAPRAEPPTGPHSAPDAAAICEGAGWNKTGDWQPWTTTGQSFEKTGRIDKSDAAACDRILRKAGLLN